MSRSPETGKAARICTRKTSTGDPCSSYRVHWFSRDHPNPKACLGHLTPAERAVFDDEKRQHARSALPGLLARGRFLNGEPACWSWPPLTYEFDEDWGTIPMWEWQAGRCAICGKVSSLVTDHNHTTGLIRGGLCSSCNTTEGVSNAPVFVHYRHRNPASILGIVERYWHPIERAYAEPSTPPVDKWKNNPMKGIGL